MAYISYPFSRDPRGLTKEVCVYAKKIMEKFPNIFVIVPHTAVDFTMFGEPKEKITDYGERDHSLAPQIEFTILSKIDLFIQGVPDDPTVSTGCIWEHAFVEWLNTWRKRKIIIIILAEMLKECED